MPHEAGLISVAVVGLAALLCGILMTRLRQPAVVGYILAGLLLGPSVAGLVVDRETIQLFAEIGVLLLLFVIGMELEIAPFLKVWRIALACTALQIGGALGFTFLLAAAFGWSIPGAVVAGFVMALSSTAVAIKMLEDTGKLDSETGRLTIAVLIAQDLAVVPMMLVLRDLSTGGFSPMGFLQVVLAVAFLIVFILFINKRGVVHLPLMSRAAGNSDLRPLAALALCLGAATISGFIGLSPAYGAFLAGVLLGNSDHRVAMVDAVHPIQSLLMMVFFLSVGLLLDLAFIWDHIGQVLAALLVVTLFKTAWNIVILRGLGATWSRAFLAGTVMGQIGEFSFVLAASAATYSLVSVEGHRMIVAIVALSLVISPLWLLTARRAGRLVAESALSLRETLRLIYGGEARSVADALHRVTRRFRRE